MLIILSFALKAHFVFRFLAAFADFFLAFTENHLHRFYAKGQFPLLKFFSQLFQFTFRQQQLSVFYSCLEVWNTAIDYLTEEKGNNKKGLTQQQLQQPDKETFAPLVQELLSRIQFSHSRTWIEIDDEDANEDVSFQSSNLDIASNSHFSFPRV